MICCITVTYGNRASFVQTQVNRLLQLGITNFVVVDNGSVAESALKLQEMAASLSHNMNLVQFSSNRGSAIGFSSGIQAAMETSADVFWVLDDDNLPLDGALTNLLEQWFLLSEEDRAKVAFACFRKDRENFQNVLQTGNPFDIFPAVNSFVGFHLKSVSKIIQSRFESKIPTQKDLVSNDKVPIAAAAYGGLWMSRNFSQLAGLPDESYVLYLDDFEFTYRFTLAGGKLYMLPGSQIEDIENSYYLPPRKGLLYHSLLEAKTEAISYYNCRNLVFFSKKYLRTSKFVYFLNKSFFLIMISLLAIARGRLRRLHTIFTGIKDGESGNLGIHPKYLLGNKKPNYETK